jgi:hypothetical protein
MEIIKVMGTDGKYINAYVLYVTEYGEYIILASDTNRVYTVKEHYIADGKVFWQDVEC